MFLPQSTATTATDERGPTFRAMREGAGLGVRALAKRAEIDHSTVSRWERGKREIADVTYEHLSQTLADYLAGKWSA